jgi:hypothetical protein
LAQGEQLRGGLVAHGGPVRPMKLAREVIAG